MPGRVQGTWDPVVNKTDVVTAPVELGEHLLRRQVLGICAYAMSTLSY